MTVTSLAPLALGADRPGHVVPNCVSGPLKSNKVCDVRAKPAERAAALVAALTQEEKLANLVRSVPHNNCALQADEKIARHQVLHA